MDQSNKKSSVLFITTPVGKTQTLKALPLNLPLADLKANLELAVGYPCNTYSLFFGIKELQFEREAIFDTVNQNGSVIRMSIKPHLEKLLDCIQEQNILDIITECSVTAQDNFSDANNTSDEQPVIKFNLGKMFFAAYICAYEGHYLLLKEIITKLPVLLSSRTLHGRSLAHIAAVSDHPLALQQVLLLAAKYGLQDSILLEDKSNKTPFDVAKEYNAYLCERLIRKFKHCKRDGSLFLLAAEEDKASTRQNTKIGRKPRAKSAVVKSNRVPSAMSTVSSASYKYHGLSKSSSVNSKTNVSCDRLTQSSGYNTEENIPELVKTYNEDLLKQIPTSGTDNETSVTKAKRVKFKTRIKSAPPSVLDSKNNHHNSTINENIRLTHNKCYQKKPFLAFREVPFEELKQQSVEYVPLDSTHFIGMDARARERSVMSILSQDSGITPYSSLNNSIQDLQSLESQSEKDETVGSANVQNQHESPVQYAWHQGRGNFIQKDDPRKEFKENQVEIGKRFTYPKTATSKRAQSANYYRAQYHIRTEQEKYEEDIPPPRPKSAGPRYRAWKPWLLEVYKEQARANKREEENKEKRKRNVRAFKKWLRQKEKEEDEASSSDEDSADDDYYEGSGETFEKWLKRKKPVLEKLDKALLEKKRSGKEKPLVNRGVTCFELVSTDGNPMKKDSLNSYMYAYQKWQRRRLKFEFWKKSKGEEFENGSDFSTRDLEHQKMQLYLDGYTYNEWLGQKHREHSSLNSRKNVHFKEKV